jgi:hypothetical protein
MIYAPKATNYSYLLYDCTLLYEPSDIDLSNAVNLSYLCNNKDLMSFNGKNGYVNVDAPNATNAYRMFEEAGAEGNVIYIYMNLPKVIGGVTWVLPSGVRAEVNLHSVTDFSNFVTPSHEFLESLTLDCTSANGFLPSCFVSNTLKTLNLTGFGYNSDSSNRVASFANLTSWGTTTDSVQSVYDSIVTNSADRSNRTSWTVVLSTNTYNAVTAGYSSFVQEASAKGYTIVESNT